MIIVELYQGRARIGNGTIRAQKWRWRATHPNGNKLATSAEAYTNRQDCLDAIDALFGPDSDIQLQQPNQPPQPLHSPTNA